MPLPEARYDYATFKTLDRAEEYLEYMFAAGEVYEGERPLIERRGGKTASWSKAHYYYVITLPME